MRQKIETLYDKYITIDIDKDDVEGGENEAINKNLEVLNNLNNKIEDEKMVTKMLLVKSISPRFSVNSALNLGSSTVAWNTSIARICSGVRVVVWCFTIKND